MLNQKEALEMIRGLAAISNNVIITKHCNEKMEERSITRMQVIRCLQKGTIHEGPFLNENGSCQVTMYRHAAGERVYCAVVIEEENLVIRTIYWE